jgi:nicotinate-nucleotide adenylyltransferase
VHDGHLRMALELATHCGLAGVRFIPAGQPPHRPAPVAGSALRLAMLEAALAGCPGFTIDRRELERDAPSFTVETLESLRDELPGRPLCLLLGLDAFLGLPRWHRWTELPGLAHLVVAMRPGSRLPTAGEIGRLLAARGISTPQLLHERPAGSVLVHPVTQLDISASAIRALVADGGDPRFLVPEPVRELIAASGCYNMDERTG